MEGVTFLFTNATCFTYFHQSALYLVLCFYYIDWSWSKGRCHNTTNPCHQQQAIQRWAYYLVVPIFLWSNVVCVTFSFSLQVSWTKLLSWKRSVQDSRRQLSLLFVWAKVCKLSFYCTYLLVDLIWCRIYSFISFFLSHIEVQTNECLENNGGCWMDKVNNVTACKVHFLTAMHAADACLTPQFLSGKRF